MGKLERGSRRREQLRSDCGNQHQSRCAVGEAPREFHSGGAAPAESDDRDGAEAEVVQELRGGIGLFLRSEAGGKWRAKIAGA